MHTGQIHIKLQRLEVKKRKKKERKRTKKKENLPGTLENIWVYVYICIHTQSEYILIYTDKYLHRLRVFTDNWLQSDNHRHKNGTKQNQNSPSKQFSQ